MKWRKRITEDGVYSIGSEQVRGEPKVYYIMFSETGQPPYREGVVTGSYRTISEARQAAEEHAAQRRQRQEAPWIACPKCGSSEDLSTVETLTGTAHFFPGEPGVLDYTGETKIDWDGQHTVTNDKGELEFWCYNCDCNWFQAVPEPEEGGHNGR